MSNDKTTLADVQPGGRVRLGDQALSTAELRRNAHVLVLQEMRTRFTDAGSPSRTAALDAAISALSAQSFPIDQTDARAIKLARGAAFAHSREHAYLPQTREETNSWQPHDWVVAAIQTALLGAQSSPGSQDALPAQAVWMLPDDARIVGVIADNIELGKLDHPGFYRNTQLAEVLRRVLDAALAAPQPAGQTFQAGVAAWMGQCFLPSLYSNMTERGDRLLEEVLELLQAHNYDKTRVATLVDYVFGRPVGEPAQEVGGVMVTLAGYCWVAGLDMHAAGDAELARINQPEVMAKIRAKQEAKNALHFDTPLPGNATAPVPAQAVDLERARDEGHDGAIRYVLGYLNGAGDCGSTAYDEILNACGRERIIRSAVEDGELEFTGLGRWVEMYGTAEDRALIDSQVVGNG
ncbi:hypothetical protein I5V52_01265 [Stenotrophomonas maltophilia]|uniref:hypothetical protein n=1 Tax=Stenotrophomonas maltophilia TaxID=40324 RepID=UPI001312DB28|nr:hypothetical protein [Stenotrophomonas maltophilia]MBH1454970.1 hypothetical protein [Stenotrophomonas maltophilia]MBH1562660.1 hypothetical protein [Stenotrophomonas maltophilia]MBH1642654.1 hypothetical protein [Stenotrophomonas maltophilia]MBH1757459.1 hypothetical protein [Stenotrophomonas maltophilia]MBH1770580.1 hypothetical protein [Stenotrophomonas maltophilia]